MAHVREIKEVSAISVGGEEANHPAPIARTNLVEKRPLKQLIVDQIAERIWKKESVIIATEVMTKDLATVGVGLNCFVLDRGEDEASDELLQFVKIMKENITNLKNQTRFQFAIKTGAHWTACDVLIEDQSPTIFILDAAFVIEAVKHIDMAFNKLFPRTKTYVYFPDEIKHEESDVFKMRRIQFDEESCALFTIDHLASLAEIDLFNVLKTSGIKGTKINPNYCRINPSNCPTELAFIFKATQSFTVLESLPTTLKNKTITSGFGYSLFQYIALTEKQKTDATGKRKKLNNVIKVFREKLIDKIANFLEQNTNSEIDTILDKHKPSKFFRMAEHDEKFIPVKSPFKAMEYFIERMLQELHERYKNKTSIEIFNPCLIGADIRILMIMSSETFGESFDNIVRMIEDYRASLTDLAYSILKKYVDNLKKQTPNATIDLLTEYRMKLNEKFSMLPPKLEATIKPVHARTYTCSTFFNRKTGIMAVGAVTGALTGGIGLAVGAAAAGLVSEIVIDVAKDAGKENRMSIQR